MKRADETISVLLIGIGGYGNTYSNAILDQPSPPRVRLAAVVDPFPEGCRRLAELRAAGIPIFATPEEFYAEHTADLAVVSAPIHLHVPYTILALEHGSHVLCEKPLGALVEDVERLIEARDRTGRFVAIGYQWSFSHAIQALKADVMAGRLGRPKRLRTLVLWPRNEQYYRRNAWAGATKTADGAWVFDSPVNNATAHYLHNMFYVIGPEIDRSAWPVRVRAELYRANPIENYDTGAVQAVTASGAEIFFYATHAVGTTRGPEFVYEFEKGTVRYGGDGQRTLTAEFADGTRRDYGDPNADGVKKLWDCVRAVAGEGRVVCGPEAAGAQTCCENGMRRSFPEIRTFPPEGIERIGDEGAKTTVVDGLAEVFTECYDKAVLPADLGVSWAVPGRFVDLTNERS